MRGFVVPLAMKREMRRALLSQDIIAVIHDSSDDIGSIVGDL